MAKKSKVQVISHDDPVDTLVYSPGPQRPYVHTTPTERLIKSRLLTTKEYVYLLILVVLSLNVRLASLTVPDSVVFDEVHFGGFARKYILGNFFMDVHPPLAKMLFAAVGLISGFKGDFDFEKIGLEYPETTPYEAMRFFPAVLGIGTVILCYLTLRSSGCRPIVCFVSSLLLLIENANVTISRYILLDSPLLFFIAAAVYSYKKFEVQVPFSFGYYKSLVACGIALGLALSSKWVGLFTVAWVGAGCVVQLWFIIGDLSVPTKKVLGQFAARGSVLLGVPVVLYLFFFYIHFGLLPNEGDGGPFMSSAFRASLNGNTIPRDIEANVGLGSIVTLRHVETQGGYLHSHNHYYPTGSKQQQITLYPHLDSNNNWLVEHYNDTTPDNEFVPVTDGMKIRLKHVNSGKRLHSHDEKPPVTERDWQKEASCYGFEGFAGDANDDFVVEIVQKRTHDEESKKNLKALTTIFRLRHAMTGTYLFSSPAKLPSWGFEQQEVTTASQGYRPLTYWYIETNDNTRINDTVSEIVNYPTLTFWDKLKESHKRMWSINAKLTDHHPWQSNPHEWPLLLRGINYWAKDSKHIYLLGNAPVWWATTTALFTFVTYVFTQIIRWQVGAQIAGEKHIFNFNYQAFSYFIGWVIHYAPFFIMGRQLFLHHYLPALYFGILTLGHFFDIALSYFAANIKTVKYVVYGFFAVFMGVSTWFYVNYSPLIYAQPWTKSQCLQAKLVGDWDFDCNAYPNSLSEYGFNRTSSNKASKSAVPNVNNMEPNEPKETPVEIVKKKAPEPESSSKKEDPAPAAQVEPEEPLAPPVADPETPLEPQPPKQQEDSAAK